MSEPYNPTEMVSEPYNPIEMVSEHEHLAYAYNAATSITPEVAALVHVGIAQAKYLERLVAATERLADTLESVRRVTPTDSTEQPSESTAGECGRLCW